MDLLSQYNTSEDETAKESDNISFHNYVLVFTEKRTTPGLELKTLTLSTRLLYNAALVPIHLVKRFSKNFAEMRGSRK